jgi:hypothetical protein
LEWTPALTTAVSRGLILVTMKKTIKHIAPWLAIAAVGGTLFLAPVASAADYGQQGDDSTQTNGTDPSVPYGTHSNSNLPYDDAGNQYSQAGAV